MRKRFIGIFIKIFFLFASGLMACLMFFSCASPASGGAGGDSEPTVDVVSTGGGAGSVGGGSGITGTSGASDASGGGASGNLPPSTNTTSYSGSNKTSSSNGFYSEGLNSLSWTTLELDISINGNVTHQSLNPGTSVQFKDADPGSTIVVSGTAKLSDGSTRPVQSDPVTIVKGNNNITLYCQYNYYLYGVSGFTNPGTYMSNQSISLPVVPDYTPAAGRTYPFAGWILNAPNLSVHGNYYPKGNSVPAKQVAGDIEFYPDYGFALYTEVSGGTKNYISAGAVQTLCSGGYLEIKGEALDGTSVSVAPSSVSGSAVAIENVSGTLKVKGVAEGTATVTYTGTTKYGAPYSVNVPVKVEPVTLRIVDASNSVISTYQQTVGNAPTFKAELIHAAPVSMSSVTWTVSVPEDTSIGFAANEFSVPNASDTLSYGGQLSHTDRSIYTKKDGTAVTGSTIPATIPDTYSGTLTITAKYDAGSGEQTVSTTLQLTGYTLPADLNVELYGFATNSNPGIKEVTGGGGYIQSGTGNSSWLNVKLNKTSDIPAITATSGSSAVYDIQFAKKVSGTYSNPHSGTSYDTTNNGISINLLDTGGLNIQRTDSADVQVTCNVDYHGRQKTIDPLELNLLARPPKIKIVVGVSGGASTSTSTISSYKTWTVRHTDSSDQLEIRLYIDDGNDSSTNKIPKPASGNPTLTKKISNYKNDFGITYSPSEDTYTATDDNGNYNGDSSTPIETGNFFKLKVGDTGSFKVTAKYTVNGVTEEAEVYVNIVGPTPTVGMYCYKTRDTSGEKFSTTKPTNASGAIGIVWNVSGSTAKVICTTLGSGAFATETYYPTLTSTTNESGLANTNTILGITGNTNLNTTFPIVYSLLDVRTSSLLWYIPSLSEIQALQISTDKSTVKSKGDFNFNEFFWTSNVTTTTPDGMKYYGIVQINNNILNTKSSSESKCTESKRAVFFADVSF